MQRLAIDRLVCLGLLVLLSNSTFAQQALVLAPPAPHIPVGGTQTLVLTPAETALTDLTFDQTIIKVNPTTLEITALKPGETDLVGETESGETTNTVKVTVLPVTLTSSLTEPLIAGEKRPVNLKIVNPSGIELPLPFELTSSNDAIAKVIGNATIEGTSTKRGDQAATITVKANGATLGSLAVRVREAIARIEMPAMIEVEEGKSRELGVKVIGLEGSEFTPADREVEFSTDDARVTISPQGVIQAADLGSQTVNDKNVIIEATSLEGPGSNNPVRARRTATVRLRPGRIDFSPRTPLLPRGGSTKVSATLFNRAGTRLTIKQVSWSLKNPDDSQFVKLSPSDDGSVTVLWKDDDSPNRPSLVELTATAESTTTQTQITDTVVIRVSGEVTDFAPLNVKLNIMDDQTATDLYGKKTAEEYFVARVRLNNNIDAKNSPALAGASILAFSDSIEIAVAYERQEVNAKGKPLPNAAWEEVDPADLRQFEVPGTVDRPANRRPAPVCQGFLTYRPYMFEMMVNTVDRRDERSPRGKTFRVLAAIGTAASFVTSVAVPGPGSDIPLAIEKYSNLLIPGIEKLWPTLRETHRQNLVSQSMKPIEEIPFGSDLSRVLFFPKKPFRGLLRNQQTRISQICPYFFEIEVAVITKQNKHTVQAGTEVPQP